MTTNNTNSLGEDTWDDPIVAEVRKVRDAIAVEFDHDIDRIARHVSEWGAERRRQQVGNIPQRLA